MVSLGGDLDWISGNDTAQVISRLGTVAGTFYVPDATTEVDARGRKVISATDFVAEHGIKTVFGIGGAFATGQLLVSIVFCDEYVPREVVEGFQAPFLRFKTASSPLLKQVFFDGSTARVELEPPGAARTETSEVKGEVEALRKELAALNHAYLDLESQLEDRTRSLKLILDSTGEGMVLVGLDGTPYGETTKTLEQWFGKCEPGVEVWDYLFETGSPDAASFEQNFSQIQDDFLPFDLIVDQLPKRFVRSSSTYELGYRRVDALQQPTRVLLVVRDVTPQVLVENAAAKARELHAVVRNVLRDQRGFHRFVEDTSELLSRIVSATDPRQQRRDIHTIKGNTAVMGFTTLPAIVHDIESRLAGSERLGSEPELQALREGWSHALSLVADFVRQREPHIEISVVEHDEFLRQLLSGIDAEKLAAIARSWREEPVASLFRRLAGQAERTAANLEKPVEIAFDDGGLRVSLEHTRECWASLVHVIRNAVDHGIEPEHERQAMGKPHAGQLELSTALEGEWLVVTIADDGRGIDWTRVREAARRASLPSETDADLMEALFTDGCSTREEVSAVSGRGVGLASARAAMRAVGGDLELHSTHGVGTEVRARMPLYAPPSEKGSRARAA
jgi:two-component system chemotaxis sensor kinase CheA